VLFAMILMQAPLVGILIPLFFVVSSVGVVSTTSFSLAMRNQGEAAGTASAMMGVLSMVGGALVAPIVGVGGSDTAVPMGIVIAVAGLSSVASYMLLNARMRRKEQQRG